MRSVPSSSSAWRAAFALTLLWAMAAGTIIQFAVGALAPFLAVDLALSRTQIGALTTVFFAVGAVCSPLAGPLVDRFGGHTMLLAQLALSAVAIAAMGLAPGFALLLAAAGLGGVATAAVNPVTNQLVAVRLARGQQGVIMGLKQSGVQVGAFLAGALLPSVALAFDWRVALIGTGVVAAGGVALAVAVLWRAPATTQGGESTTAAGDLGAVGASPAKAARPVRFVAWLSAYAVLMGAGGVAVVSFVVLYAVEELAWSESAAGGVAATVGLVGVGARMVWGRAAERMRTSTAPLLVLAAGSAVAQALVWTAQLSPALLWVGAVAFGATAGSWNSVAMLAIVREVAAEHTGWASGIVQAAFYVGLMACPPVFGWSVDATGGYDAGWAGVTALLAVTAGVTAWWHQRDVRRVATAG